MDLTASPIVRYSDVPRDDAGCPRGRTTRGLNGELPTLLTAGSLPSASRIIVIDSNM